MIKLNTNSSLILANVLTKLLIPSIVVIFIYLFFIKNNTLAKLTNKNIIKIGEKRELIITNDDPFKKPIKDTIVIIDIKNNYCKFMYLNDYNTTASTKIKLIEKYSKVLNN